MGLEGSMRWITIALLLGVMMRSAAAADTAPWPLADCLQAALSASPDLAASAADIAAARARLAEADAGRYGDAGYTQYLGAVQEAHGDPTRSTTSTTDYFSGLGPFTRLDLNLAIPLYTFGKLQAALEAAQRGLESEEARSAARRATIVASTKQLYYGLLLARQLADVLRDMGETLDKAVATTERRLREKAAGITELDLLRLKVGRARFRKGVAEVNRSVDLARHALARAVGRADDASFDIAEQRLRPVTATLQPLEAYLAAPLETRPEWAQLRAGLAAQQAKVAVEEADYYPKFFFNTGVQFAYAGNRDEQKNPFAYDNFNYLHPVGVIGLNWDLNFFNTRAKVDEARAELDRIRARQQEAETGLPLELRKAYADVTQQRETMTAAEEGRKAARGWLVLAVSNFDLAIGSAEDLFDGLGAYTQTSSDYFQAVHDYNVAVAELSRIVGEVTDLQY
jgi:outer membrane protein TolC